MRQARFLATTALGLCLVAAPHATFAQSAGDGGDVTVFTPSVRDCIAAPAQTACADLLEVMAQCGANLDYTLCAPLFEAPTQVFQDPAQMTAAASLLAGVSATPLDPDTADLGDGTTPELVTEPVPDDFRTPPDPVRVLNTRQQAALDLRMADPDVAAAVARLAEVQVEDGSGTNYPQALFALQRAQRGDGPGDEADEPVEVNEGAVAAGDIRRSQDDFATRPAMEFDAAQGSGDEDSELDRAGLGSLARLAVGMPVGDGQVEARANERVVIRRSDADPALWRDDDAILRDVQSQRRIERYADGSTLTRWQRANGSWTISIRDVTGRALWREVIMADGTSVALINDLEAGEGVDLSVLPEPAGRELRVTDSGDPALAMALLHEAESDARALERTFTLRQVREVRELRDMLPVLGPVAVAFRVNGSSISTDEANRLESVGRLIERLVAENPREMFLVEGHTDATGTAAYNLALSDRRAESVALVLVETFAIPPENLVVQGYGERHLRVPTAGAEPENRRVAIRRISPLLGQ